MTWISLTFRGSRRGLTLVEVVIASAIAVFVSAGIVFLLFTVARQQRVAFIEAQVARRADRIQDKIMEILRRASRNQVVPFSVSDAVPGQPSGKEVFFYRIIFRSGDNQPNQQLRFDPSNRSITYDPDLSVANDEVRLDQAFANSPLTRVEYVWFAQGVLPTGSPDNSLILVQLEVNDQGLARRSWRNPANRANWIIATRTFAVNLRQY
ncbi:MAG: prepilin-type N-terminal cleavage/methylation domain-containing protein [Candidatus Sumerlaeaceae bacterium]|nr:prepilin-type N-terminal cleavage/methylation domain-containing protein [Candidatus Sumerlaeaceae bacterium]